MRNEASDMYVYTTASNISFNFYLKQYCYPKCIYLLPMRVEVRLYVIN